MLTEVAKLGGNMESGFLALLWGFVPFFYRSARSQSASFGPFLCGETPLEKGLPLNEQNDFF